MKNFLRKRSVVTLVLLPSFIFVTMSGVMLFIWPPRGVISGDFALLGGDHHFWEELHIMGSILMMAVMVFHLFMNWKPLKGHLVGQRAEYAKLPISREAVMGILFFGIILASAIGDFFPESAIMDLREGVRELWRSGLRAGA